MWEVVYEREDYGGGYGHIRVGIKIPDGNTVVWFGYTDGNDDAKYSRREGYAKEICDHMNGLERKENSREDICRVKLEQRPAAFNSTGPAGQRP